MAKFCLLVSSVVATRSVWLSVVMSFVTGYVFYGSLLKISVLILIITFLNFSV